MTPGCYHLQSRFFDGPVSDLPLASTICALVAGLSQDWADTAQDSIGLHGGAVRIGGRLIQITGPAGAGKSTLITRLAFNPGVRFFCDDVLPVDGQGWRVALGIAPRLRLPLPPGDTGLASGGWIVADERYGYLRLPDQAPHGTAAPLDTIILLDRRERERARFRHLDPAEALSTLLRQSISGYRSGADAFARARELSQDRLCLRLVCSDLEETNALIMASFGPGDAGLVLAPALPATQTGNDRPDPRPLIRSSVATAARGCAIMVRPRGLWQPGDPMRWELNRIGHAVWLMLDLPGSAGDLAAALAPDLPDQPLSVLSRDIAVLLAALEVAGLVSRASA